MCQVQCAGAPASLCVITEESQDQKQLTLTAFDPLKGRGKVLRTIQKDPTAMFTLTALSPDGTTFAISRAFEAEIHIRLLSLWGTPVRKYGDSCQARPVRADIVWPTAKEGEGILGPRLCGCAA